MTTNGIEVAATCLCGALIEEGAKHRSGCPWPEASRAMLQINQWVAARRWLLIRKTFKPDLGVHRLLIEFSRAGVGRRKETP